jgi:lauroyl/myristoyl acyltransferase
VVRPRSLFPIHASTLFTRASALVRPALVRAPAPLASWLSGPILRHYAPERMVTEDKLARVFPTLGPAEVGRLRRALWTRSLRSLLAYSFIRHEEWAFLRGRVRVSGLELLPEGAAILLNWHLGASRVARHALRWSGRESLVITAAAREEDDAGVAYIGRESRVEERAAVALRALRHLRAGGLVMVMGDGPMGERAVPVPVLGQTPRMRLGVVTLAQLAKVPVHPITATWEEDRRIHVRLHPALPLPFDAPPARFLERAAAVMAAWLERHLRASPLVLTAYHVDWLLGVEPGLTPDHAGRASISASSAAMG